MTEKRVGDRVFKLPKRYQSRRKVEKEMLAYERKLRGIDNTLKKIIPRKDELQIPIEVDKRTTYYVRESKIFKPKWLRYFNDIEHLKNYIENYKQILK